MNYFQTKSYFGTPRDKPSISSEAIEKKSPFSRRRHLPFPFSDHFPLTSLGRIQPVTDPTTTVPSSASTTTPVPAIPERTLTTSSLQQHLQQNIPLDRSRIPSSSASSVSSVSVNRNNTFTDLALGRTIQDLMRPGVAGGQPTSSTTAAAGGEVLCRTACNLLNNGAHSIATCTTTYPHRCVQDLIKEEMGGGSRTPGTLSQAGSLVNIHIESELQQHAATGGGGGFQSHPNSGRSSPAHTMFHHGGSPPKHLSAIGHSMSIPSSTRVSRAPSPSFLHAAVAEHSRFEHGFFFCFLFTSSPLWFALVFVGFCCS